MTTVLWTARAQADLAAIHAFVELDSPHFAEVVVRRLIGAVERLTGFPQSGRSVPEYSQPAIREVILSPYRIVYRVVDADTVHILTVHHGARTMPHQWMASYQSTFPKPIGLTFRL